jgi:hypothetical protein
MANSLNPELYKLTLRFIPIAATAFLIIRIVPHIEYHDLEFSCSESEGQVKVIQNKSP